LKPVGLARINKKKAKKMKITPEKKTVSKLGRKTLGRVEKVEKVVKWVDADGKVRNGKRSNFVLTICTRSGEEGEKKNGGRQRINKNGRKYQFVAGEFRIGGEGGEGRGENERGCL